MDKKGNELKSENVADRFRPIAQGLGLIIIKWHVFRSSQVSFCHKRHTGLAKSGQLSQVKRIQPKTNT